MIWFSESSFYQHLWGLECGSFSVFLQCGMYTCNHIELSLFQSWTLPEGNRSFEFALCASSLGILELNYYLNGVRMSWSVRIVVSIYWGSDLLVWIVSTKVLNCGRSCNFVEILNIAENYWQMRLKLWFQCSLETPKTDIVA